MKILLLQDDCYKMTLLHVVHINVEINNVNLTLFDVVNPNVEIHNAVSMLIGIYRTSRSRINEKTTLKQR